MRRTNYWILLLLPLVVGPACDCGDDDPTGGGGGGGGDVGDGGTGGSGPIIVPDGGTVVIPGVDGGDPTVCQITICPGESEPFACGDCVDNDDDGLVDTGRDPDCLGPCHNNEAGYNIGLTGQPETQCRVDCYYDSESGRGCDWSWQCDPLQPRLDDSAMCQYVGDAEYGDVTPCPGGGCTSVIGSSDCHEVSQTHDEPEECGGCRILTPPGCDCFGCCEIPARSGNFVFIGTMTDAAVRTCNFDEAMQEYNDSSGTPAERLGDIPQDERQCRLCTPIDTCYRPCESEGCQLCLGETEPPPGCEEPPPDVCNGRDTCSPISDNVCPAGTFCFFGCCDPIIVPL